MFLAMVIIVVLGFVVWTLGTAIRKGIKARPEARRRGTSVAEMWEQDKAERVHKAKEEWRVLLELDIPTPRPVRSGGSCRVLAGQLKP